jgi:hypothetical protein
MLIGLGYLAGKLDMLQMLNKELMFLNDGINKVADFMYGTMDISQMTLKIVGRIVVGF